MNMVVAIEEIRQKVDTEYLGFHPDSRSIKPAHVANGLFRTLLSQTFDVSLLNAFVVSQQDNGKTPRGHDLDTVFSALATAGRLHPDVDKDQVKQLRPLLKKVVNADDAVYLHKDRMESYTAGSERFLSEDRIAQSGGELIAHWLQRIQSPLGACITDTLRQSDDAITALCAPLLSNDAKPYMPKLQFEKARFLTGPIPSACASLWNGLAQAADTLAKHLCAHPNKLYRLRLAVLFSSVVLIRHMACLESYYVPGARPGIPPLLLDFSDDEQSPTARASLMSYTHVCQSLSRFYGWAFGEQLKEFYVATELPKVTPTYKRPEAKPEWQEIWDIALADAQQSVEPFVDAGQALYDILALESEGDPVRYLRQLGHRSGILWPPENLRPAKRFAVQQDMLEVLIRSSVEPGETIDMPTLQSRLWDRFGIVIGGGRADDGLLLDAGIYQADSDALALNRQRFAERLNGLDFARLLADGVLQVELEVPHAS